ncbi:MAG: tetratricopeptide repeat protein [Bryobacterales bacterium]|nr:tetratricopeptide repeat protein [Bryobacterales bacterium]
MIEGGRIVKSFLSLPAALLLVTPLLPGQVASRDIVLEDRYVKQPVALPRAYALVVGVSDYKNLPPKQDLRFAERDAEAIYNVLISPEGGNLDFQNVRKLLGADATLANLREALETWLPQTLTEADQLYIFFVGHGMSGPDGRVYLSPYDIDVKSFAQSAYPLEQLATQLTQKIKARRKVLLLDACHSGDVSPVLPVQKAMAALPQDLLVLTSSRSTELSFEDANLAGGRGLFSYFLERGWRGEADVAPNDGFVVAGELIQYLQREVSRYATERGREQNPAERGRYENKLILGFNPERRTQVAARTPELAFGGLVVQVNRTETRIFLDGKDVGEAAPGKELQLPGISPGAHTVRAVRKGYDPVEIPVNVVPGIIRLIEVPMKYSRRIKASSEGLQQQGTEAWRKGRNAADFRRAGQLFEKALAEDDRNSEAALGLCRVQQALGEDEAARKSCERAIRIDADFADAHHHLAILKLESGDANGAVRSLLDAARLDPKNALIQSNLAMAYLDVDKYREAEQAATKAIELAGPGSSAAGQALNHRGEARRFQGRFEEAIPDYQQSLKNQSFDSGFLRHVYYWGFSFAPGLTTKHRSGVRPLYREQKATALAGLCAAEMGRKRHTAALDYCKQAIAVDRQDENTQALYAEVFKHLFMVDNRIDYLEGAIEASERALALNPDMDNAAKLKASLEEMQGIRREMRQSKR